MRPIVLRRLLPLALVAACAPHAGADDPVPPPATPPGAAVDPAWSGPPPGPEPAALPEPPPAAPAEAPAPSPVAAPAPARTDLSHLPPPVIRRAGQPRSAPLPSSQPAATYPPPSSFSPPPSTYPPPSTAPIAPPPASGTSFPAAAPQAPPSTGAASASILSVTKNHNIPLSDGTLALRLDTRYRVDDTTSYAYRVWITFFDRATGLAVPATKPTFADAQGGLHVMTKPAHSTAAGLVFDAPLFIPYVVFPDPGVGQSTEIEARVELTRVEGVSQEVPVATSSTTFRVHGAPLDPAATPAGAPAATPPVTEFPAAR